MTSMAAALTAAAPGSDAAAALTELTALTQAINPAVGDALSGRGDVESKQNIHSTDVESTT
jgi:hypothetical protein